MKLTLPRNVSNLTSVEEIGRHVQVAFDDIEDVINGNVEFNQNINTAEVTVTFDTANVDTLLQHNLGRIPNGYFVVGLSVASILYSGASASTTSLIYLRSSVANTTAKVMVF